MVAEVLEHLEPGRGGVFVDCTVGLGGHARALLDAGASALIGMDRDTAALAAAAAALEPYGARVSLSHRDYRQLDAELDGRGIGFVDGVLADLGVSSMQLDEPGRGFSFRRDEPLDMRMDTTAGATAAESLRVVDEGTLADVIYRLGYSRIDPATRTFQAIRIWVNGELEGLDRFVAAAARRLAPGGRMVVITFHSLEDRVVKHTLRALQAAGEVGLTIRTKRPVVPGDDEIERNPRARSAKLRAAERNGRAG
jgi:16S rRNA (cytosine1402-N4)-methyltransferase